jgi:predicted aspartyl protease
MKTIAILLALGLAAAAPGTSGDLAFRRGDFDAAAREYAGAVAASPNDADAQLGLGTMDLYDNDLAGARTHLDAAARLDPNNPRTARLLHTLALREPQNGTFTIAMSGAAVEMPFIVTDPLPMVRARIDGHDATLIIDTGATAIALSADAAKRFGIATQAVGQGTFAGGKHAEVSAGRIDRFDVQGLSVGNIAADILPGAMQIEGHAVDGAIGTTFLRHFLSTIDYKRARLVLRPASASAAFEASAANGGASVVPMWLAGDHFIFARARVNAKLDGLFSIDTGGEGIGVQLTKASLAQAGIAIDASQHPSDFTGGGGTVPTLPFRAATVSIGSIERTDVPGLYFPGRDQFGIFPFAVAGTISHEFFKTTSLTFDFAAMKMIVS